MGISGYGKKNFVENFQTLPQEIQKRIILENDDKSYQVQEVLEICHMLEIPMVLDVHHFKVNNQGEKLMPQQVETIFSTWKKEKFPPKIHFSTPRSQTEKRAHAEYINPKDWENFYHIAKQVGQDFDVMIEAKAKDLAVLALREKETYL